MTKVFAGPLADDKDIRRTGTAESRKRESSYFMTGHDLKKHFDVWWVAGLTIAFWSVALTFLIDRSLWSDELAGILTAQRPFTDGLLQLQDYAAPLYQMVLRVLMNSEYPPEWLVRLPALLASVLALAAVWFMAKGMFGRRAAAIAVLLVAVNPMFMKYAGEARPYSMFLLFSVLSMFAFYRFLERRDAVRGILYVAATVLLVYAHYYGFFVLAAQAAYAASRISIVQEDRRRWKAPAASFLAVALASLPALFLISRFYLSGVRGIVGWIDRPQLIDLLWVRQTGELMGDGSLSALCLAAIVAALVRVRPAVPDSAGEKPAEHAGREAWWLDREPVLLCLYWMAFSLYLPLVISYVWRPVYIDRYGFPVLVPLAMILSSVVARFRFKYMAAAAAMLSALLAYNTAQHLAGVSKVDYAATVYALDQLNKDGSPVYVTHYPYCEGYRNPELYGLRYYGYKGKDIRLLTMAYPDFTKIADPGAIPKDRRIFVVAFNKWPAVEAYFRSQWRAYRILHFGYMHLFEIEKEGIQKPQAKQG